ncbi:DUF968 domain-containing protein [Salmonella enterica]|nr:DUF968 domain-containing protein [Salmonella enterica]EGF8993404.1 DUF968 domain-containing protein [Salmonella enterica]EIA5069841.1 DUF968 domain-containing protein [Salmonella enterica]EJK6587722.1 DUF968 domain-containing protein [Salmonella enterica]
MRAILTAFPQNAAKVTLLRSGNLTSRLRDGQRVMICDVPRQLENTPAGEIPESGQWLAQDEALQSFFSDSRVINAAGGPEGLKTWVSRMPDCQCAGGDHVVNMTTAQTPDGGAVRLCHACDNVHYMKGYRDLSDVIIRNRAEWIVDYARMSLRLGRDHQMTLPELFCWAVLRGVTDAMPVNVIRRFASLPEDEVLTGTIKEADINPWQLSARQLVEKKAGEGIAATPPDIHTVSGAKNLIKDSGLNGTATERVKPVLTLSVDSDPAAGYMRKPKMIRLELPEYTRWVKRQPCCGCGNASDDPHHIIDHGFGGTGTKACDLLVIPLCRVCHDMLHKNVKAWEEQNGSQLLWLARTLARATGIGAITAARAKE